MILTQAQFRSELVFLAPDAYRDDYITVVAVTATQVTLDGAAIPPAAWSPLAEFSYPRLPIADGVHTLTAAAPVGVTVYGYDDDVSYGYPAGTSVSGE